MTDELEVFRLSAKACGKTLDTSRRWIVDDKPVIVLSPGYVLWDPFTNDSHRWECVRTLLKMGCQLRIGFSGDDYHDYYNVAEKTRSKEFNCPAEEFPAIALAEIYKRSRDE